MTWRSSSGTRSMPRDSNTLSAVRRSLSRPNALFDGLVGELGSDGIGSVTEGDFAPFSSSTKELVMMPRQYIHTHTREKIGTLNRGDKRTRGEEWEKVNRREQPSTHAKTPLQQSDATAARANAGKSRRAREDVESGLQLLSILGPLGPRGSINFRP